MFSDDTGHVYKLKWPPITCLVVPGLVKHLWLLRLSYLLRLLVSVGAMNVQHFWKSDTDCLKLGAPNLQKILLIRHFAGGCSLKPPWDRVTVIEVSSILESNFKMTDNKHSAWSKDMQSMGSPPAAYLYAAMCYKYIKLSRNHCSLYKSTVIEELASSLVCVLLRMYVVCWAAGGRQFLGCQTCGGPLASFSTWRYQQLIVGSCAIDFAN